MEKTCNFYGRFFQGVLIGGFVGVLAGIFFAPKSGEELRGDLREKSKEAQAFLGDARNRAAGWKEEAKHRFSKAKEVFGKKRAPEYTESMDEFEGTA